MSDPPVVHSPEDGSRTVHFDEDALTRSLHTAKIRYDQLLELSHHAGKTDNVVSEVLSELSAMMAVLNVTAEELRAQNHALRDAHDDVERQRAHYEELFTLVPDAYVVTDVYATVLEANQAAEQLFGIPADRLTGKPLAVFIAEDQRADFRRGLSEVRSSDARLEWTALITPRSGTPIRATLRVAHIRDGASHPQLGWIIRDTTEKQRVVTLGQRFAEEQTARIDAERAARRFRVLAEASRQLSATTDLAGICQSIAKAVVKYGADHCEILLLEGQKLVSHSRINREPRQASFTEALRRRHNMSVDAEQSLLWRALRTNEPQVSPAAADGPRNAVALPLSSAGKAIGVLVVMGTSPSPQLSAEDVGVLLEIATRASLAIANAMLFNELARANREKADFLAVLSHELRTPLTAVMGYSDLLLSGIPDMLPDRARGHIERIRACSWHQLSVVEQILLFARVEGGADEIETADVNVQAVVHEAIEIVTASARDGKVQLNVDVPPGDITLHTDAGRLRQILTNLLANAFKFTDEGAVSLVVRRTDDDIFFTIADTGIGIAPEDVTRIFDPFWRAGQASNTQRAGMGLGLAVSGRLAHALGGDISVQSQVGVGTSFTLRLPMH
ncbi:MAG: ATP-binding protein [Gemmatimonadota bacterium]